MTKTYDVPAELSIDDLALTLEDLCGSGLDELVKTGAKLILEMALREEVLDFLGRERYEHGGEEALPGYLNGHRVLKKEQAEVKREAKKTAAEKSLLTIKAVDNHLETA